MNNNWYPTSIDYIRKNLLINNYIIKSNIAYEIQYIEYVEQLLNTKITTSLKKMLIKNYIISSISIIESLLYYLFNNNNNIYIKFNTLIKMLKNNNILDLSNEEIITIISLKKLRNKIHINNHILLKSNYYSFNKENFNQMKIIIKKIINNNKISKFPFII